MVGRDLEELPQAALGVVGQRVHPHEVLLRAGDPHRRATLRERAGAAHRGDHDLRLGRDQGGRQQPGRGQAQVQVDPAVDADVVVRKVLERFAPDVQDRVRAHQGVAQRTRLFGEQVLRLGAILGRGQVQIARHAHQLVLAERVAGTAAAMGDVRLDRPEVLAPVEDHRQLLRERERRDPQGHRGRRLRVDQCPPQEIV